MKLALEADLPAARGQFGYSMALSMARSKAAGLTPERAQQEEMMVRLPLLQYIDSSTSFCFNPHSSIESNSLFLSFLSSSLPSFLPPLFGWTFLPSFLLFVVLETS